MATLTRTRVVVVAIALLVGLAVWPHGSHAATGGTTTILSADTTVTSTASNVKVSNAFPDGNTSAQCFIQVNDKTGVMKNTFGNCAGITLTITCASSSFDLSLLAPSGIGASLNLNGNAVWTGAYDQGTNPACPTSPTGTKASLTADLAGVAAGQNVVWFVNGSNTGHFGTSTTERSGCWQMTDSAGTSSPGCVIINGKTGPGGAYYEATAGGTTDTAFQTANASNTAYPDRADTTLGGVYVEAPGQTAVATNTPGGATNTPLPPTATPTRVPGPSLGARLVQFGADSTLTATSSGVTNSQVFPDGGTQAACFVKVTTKSGAQTQTYGNCAGYTVNVTCASGTFSKAVTSDQHGAAINEPSLTGDLSGAYDTGPSCANVPLPGHNFATSSVDVSGLAAGTKVVFWWNNDGGTGVRNGCVSFKDATGAFSVPGCFQNNPAGLNGAYYEVAATGATGTAYQFQGPAISSSQGGLFSGGNLTIGGVFISATGGGLPLAAQYVNVSHVHGLSKVHWYSPLTVRGFNVFSGKTKLNSHVVTGKLGWYTFSTRQAIRHLRLVPVSG